jgi:hypothetical protein
MKALAIIPAYTHIDHRLMMALLEADVPFLPLHGSSDLPKARSLLITAALQKGAERVLFVDSDVVPTPAQLSELAATPLVTPEQAVSGLYPIRDLRATRQGGAAWAVDAVDPETAGGADVIPANWAGLGFAAVHAESLRRLAATLPVVREPDNEWRPFCVPRVEAGVYYPDDRVLWWQLALTGTRLVALASLKVGHVASVVLRDCA